MRSHAGTGQWRFCLGRFSQYWGAKLASHGLSQEDGEGLPVRLRSPCVTRFCPDWLNESVSAFATLAAVVQAA